MASLNTLAAFSLPLLKGTVPQPRGRFSGTCHDVRNMDTRCRCCGDSLRLISRLFDKNLTEEDWLPSSFGVLGSLSLCLLVQWSMTIWALASEYLDFD